MGEVWTVTFRASFSSNPCRVSAGLCGLFSSQVAEEGFVCCHNASDASQSWENFWGGVEAVPHFHRGVYLTRWWRMEVRDFHPMCAFALALSSFPKRVTSIISKAFLYTAQQRQLCRGGSSFLTLQSSLFCHLILEDNLSCQSCLASLPWPLWAIKSLVYTPTPWQVCAVHTHKPTHSACSSELDSLW